MIRKLLFLTGVKILFLSLFVKSEAKLRMTYYEHDPLLVAKCESKCWLMDKRSLCVNGCLLKPFKKPGSCPKNITNESRFAGICVHVCDIDTQCPGLSKCCQHRCGFSCQKPENLSSAVGVPNIPKYVKVTGRRKRAIYIDWSSDTVPTSETTIYLLEERHHAGKKFVESKMSKWIPFSRTNRTKCVLKKLVKPGFWYQFRVAAVNENGTKGFSGSSTPFSLSVNPKPPRAPPNVTVGPIYRTPGGGIRVELKWAKPPSDWPIQRYKVFWSIRLHGIKALDSVLVKEQVVSKNQTHFLLQNLTANSLYFLQVQAIAQYENQRLKSEKSNLALNTSNYINDVIHLEHTAPTIENLHLCNLSWTKGVLRAKVVWRHHKGPKKYTVTWWNSGQCDKKSHLKLSATITESNFELYNLKFNCRYRVTVKQVREGEKIKSNEDTSITFETPSCKKFSSAYKKIKCTE